MRPATDAEALAHSVLRGEPVVPVPDAIVRGAQSFEDAREAFAAEEGEEPEHREAAGALDEDDERHATSLIHIGGGACASRHGAERNCP